MADTKISGLSDGTAPAGTDQFAVARSGANNNLSWTEMLAAMPGAEIGYDQITTTVDIASSTEATGTTIITCAAHTFDGQPVIAHFFSPIVLTSSVDSTLVISLFESSTEIGIICWMGGGSAVRIFGGLVGELRFTPSAGSHTYKVTAVSNQLAGPPQVGAGGGGTGVGVPAFIRFTKV